MSIRMNDRVSPEFVNTEVVYGPSNLTPGDVVIANWRDREGNFYGHALRIVTEDGLYSLQTGVFKSSLKDTDIYPLYFKMKPGVL